MSAQISDESTRNRQTGQSVPNTVGFVPNRSDVDAKFAGFDEGGELGISTVSEPIANAECVFRRVFIMIVKLVLQPQMNRMHADGKS